MCIDGPISMCPRRREGCGHKIGAADGDEDKSWPIDDAADKSWTGWVSSLGAAARNVAVN